MENITIVGEKIEDKCKNKNKDSRIIHTYTCRFIRCRVIVINCHLTRLEYKLVRSEDKIKTFFSPFLIFNFFPNISPLLSSKIKVFFHCNINNGPQYCIQ